MRMRLLAPMLMAAVMALPAAARDVNGRYAVFGAGNRTCSQYLQATRQGGAAIRPFDDWLLGHLSAYNLLVANTYDMLGHTDFAHFDQRLQRDCRQHPRSRLVAAVARVMDDLYPQRANISPRHSGWNEFRPGTGRKAGTTKPR